MAQNNDQKEENCDSGHIERFKISPAPLRISSINRTIRFRPEVFDWIMDKSMETGVSFNMITNQCLEYAISNAAE